MPYHIGEQGSYGCSGFPVIKDSDSSVMGCHKTEQDAKKQLAALYINEPEASKEEKSTVKDLTTAFFSIVKSTPQEDGTLMVYGKATDDSLDIDQQICDPVWLDTAMPEWFKSGGNIREQHSSIAAGVAKEYEKKADGHYIHALVVDPVSVKKVDNGVLKGFSIGIKSPRVVRDTKAANGRIIDGQIVEVSLVDRPANPNCQLVLAKSAEGESGMWKVEELIEKSDAPEAEIVLESVESKEETVKTNEEIIAEAKSIAGDLVKFDAKAYEAARTALAQLIIVEGSEMKEGSDERFSLANLLNAIHALETWYEGERAEGEVAEGVQEDIEMAAKSADACADCGCHKETTEAVAAEEEKSIEPEVKELADQELPEAPVEEVAVEEPAVEAVEEVATEVAEEKVSVDDESAEKIEAIVEKAIKSATESLKSEMAELMSAKEAALTKAVGLESELAVAKSLAVAGGPKRTIKPIDATTSDLLVKAATYKAKAEAATDPDLVKGFKALATKYEAEYDSLNKTN